ncbi:FtsX-like permease family protein [Solibaculum mannosilyticum]|uniref:FtsX-like permease family protein n=1 Tax=Solibaculum mannosilyticum TaxID=2780922 RepID=UPI0034B6A117
MKRRSAIVKEALREIWKTRNRFLSILAIVAIGTGFFAGVKSSCPDMILSATQYYDSTQLSDLHLLSTFGFNDNDLNAIRQTDGIRGFMPSYSVDVMEGDDQDSGTVLKVLSLPQDVSNTDDPNNLNQPLLVEGRLPEKSGECVVDYGMHAPSSFTLGNTITLRSGNDPPLSDTLSTDTYTIVGIVNSPSYINFERGNTLLGDGSIDAFIMVPEEDFVLDVYTDIYLTLDSTEGLSPFESPYDDAVDTASQEMETLADTRSKERYDELYSEAKQELDNAKQELADGEEQQATELGDAWQKIEDAQKELDDGWAAYYAGVEEFNTKISEGQAQIDQAEQQIEDGEAQYQEGLKQYQEGQAQYDQQLPAAWEQIGRYEYQAEQLEQQLAEGQQKLDDATLLLQLVSQVLIDYETTYAPDPNALPEDLVQTLAQIESLSSVIPEGTLPDGTSLEGVLTQYVTLDPSDGVQNVAKQLIKKQADSVLSSMDAELTSQSQQLEEGYHGLDSLQSGIQDARNQLEDTKKQLDEAKQKLEDSRKQLDEGAAELASQKEVFESEKKNGQKELDDSKQKLEEGDASLAQAKSEYDSGKAESDQQLADARKQIEDGERQLDDLTEPTWYVWDRTNNPGYSSYEEDAQKVDAVAAVFPVFFILVAALVCLTTMTRMVEEHRTQIGTMKALGYSRRVIMSKYLFYAVSASFLGSVIGLAVGFQLFPRIIIGAYRILYNMPDPLTPIHWDYALWCTLAAVACTGLSTLASCYKELLAYPAQLMRPRAPKSGKRVLLERVTFLWSRLSFIYKVTLRNLFRYKKRILMTVISIAGCTALMLTGFGLQNSIASIAPKQFGSIFLYDGIAAMDDGITSQDVGTLQEEMSSTDGVENCSPVLQREMDITNGKTIKSATLFVPQSTEDFSGYVSLQERVGHQALSLSDDGVILTEKLAKMLSVGVGDSITLTKADGRPLPTTVSGITENYAMHYIYMTPTLYNELFGEEPSYNMMLFHLAEGADQTNVSNILMTYDNVLGVSYSSDINDSFNDTISSLNSIVWVLILSAGALAIIVLYNLTNINVNERIRELATIKVLGFYDREVSAYIYRENIISSLIGVAAGLVLGIFFERFVIQTAEVDAVMFSPDIAPYCFILSAVLTLLFIAVVNFAFYFKLKKIDMVESLKSVE